MTNLIKAVLSNGETIESRINATGGRTTGFDYLRIALSVAVICVHSVISSYGFGTERALWSGPWRPFTISILPMFFGLSGFLVTGSILRVKTKTEFVMLRALRIIPALFVEVIVVAFILGPLVTILPLKEYFTADEFLSYPLNIIGYIHYLLPGVFLHNPDPEWINRQLWTIPSELRCYIALMGLSALGLIRRPKIVLFMILVLLVALPVSDEWRHQSMWLQNTLPGKALVLSFLVGVMVYLFKDKIHLNGYLFGIALFLSYALLYLRGPEYLATVPLGYVTVYLGMSNPKKTIITATGDYSYGMYLYGYPIQQTYSYLFPDYCVWWMNIIFTIIVGMMLAALSWHLVEHRVLQKRKPIIAWAERGVAAISASAMGLFAKEDYTPSVVASAEQSKDR